MDDEENKPSHKSGAISRAPAPINPMRGSGRHAIARKVWRIRAADWNFWSQMINVELWKAVALSCNREPRDTEFLQEWRETKGPYGDDSLVVSIAQFTDRLEITKSHLSTHGKLKPKWIIVGQPADSGVNLSEFASWALGMKWEIPPEFAAMADTAHESDKSKDSKPQSSTDLGTRERETALKIIAGLLVQGFKSAEISKPYGVAREIKQALQSSGLDLSDDTIAKWIKDAAALLPGDEKKTK